MSNPNPSPATRFQPGVSGNIHRRSDHVAYLRGLLTEKVPDALKVLFNLLEHGKPKEQIAAVKICLEYGIGKPATATIEVDDEGNNKGITILVDGVEFKMPQYKSPGDDSKLIEGS